MPVCSGAKSSGPADNGINILVGRRKNKSKGPEAAVSMARAQLVKGTWHQMG